MAGIAIDPEVPQRQAADPGTSVWVAASAGTGKTKVLTDRVLSLLLAGNAPERLLCLTFTKAAAAEMSNRISFRLAGWATDDDTRLAADLARLTGRPAGEADLTRARRLFAQVLDTPGGMRIETIHAFCQSLLRRFPLEAGLAPHFQVMDDRDAGEMLAQAREEVLAAARDGAGDGPGGKLAEALAVITGAVHETAFPDLMAELTGVRGRLRRLIDHHDGRDGVIDALRRRLGLEADDTAYGLVRRAVSDGAFDAGGCRAAMRALQGGKAGDQERAGLMNAWLAASEDERLDRFALWQSAFLTGKGEIRARLCTKDVEARVPGTLAILQSEAERLFGLAGRLRSAVTLASTASLLTLGEGLLASYERQKTARAMLDYDDLILAAVTLLERPGSAAWVLYKLDGGIDHVLIDEAQDTNPDQWRVIRALTGEFFAGEGQRRAGERTVFAVGDAKQSIYSFQRADPREFEAMRGCYAAQVPAAQGRWAEVALSVSFRSAPAVLDAVDRVINSPAGGDGVVAPGQTVTHLAFREGAAGLVEIWPPIRPAARDEPEPWKPPVERVKGDSPRARLAQLVARRIEAMVKGGEILASRGRPIRPGDVLVLVRRRNAFVEELVRELKTLGIAVAGADRMVLTEQLAVMDLMALANVMLLPDDDLTLATVLKGPLIGLSEEDLFRLAWGRRGGLWEALRERSGEEPFAAAWRQLSEWLSLADQMPPHDFFARVLTEGGKSRLLARLGLEAEDPLDEFVTLTLAYERGHPPSLQGFLRWLEEGAVEIKRDLEQGDVDAVRIMTVHGAKGLQAPIVFLPDTLQVPTRPPRLLWLDEGESELLAWPPRADDQDENCRAARDAANRRRDEEYRRLLYVAMTRAEDRLYVCGWETRRAAAGHCWYRLIEGALRPLCEPEPDTFLDSQRGMDDIRVLRLISPQTAAVVSGREGARAPSPAPLPDWARLPAPPEPVPPRPLAPSRPDEDEPEVRSPYGTGGDAARFQRGRLIHRLLQSLPDLATAKRNEAAARFLGRPGWALSFAEQAALAGEVVAILNDPEFAPIFGPGSRAEVPVVGQVGERILSGQVDRLLVTEKDVLIVDFKTNRPPPRRPADVAAVYLRQMAAYRAALACIYPGRTIRCALLWTDAPRLMALDNAVLDDALSGLTGR
ncbi:double-strand break repair helicase AddA [Telmatospirillum siberiense]|uniref:DNA 3'-5' helicase n=1 Tax=Telmatospirillum siberiense TaxID=382514 RepID=A0A2N3PM73_9PROT|nr:double-strand break repair helicase AddA [Telmatospirillum siberiense]PKU21509.1 double-strand break repair helicase AddA [Telmatospirillum siberiense]